ncbi:MAG: sigma-70 family RNA polymerase sigma factor [Terriglobia bacterium]
MRKDELHLWRSYGDGDPDALEGLLSSYKRLICVWADCVVKASPRADREDLIQEGMMRLPELIQRFDPDRGCEFTTYARQRVFEVMYRSIRESRNLTQQQYKNFRKVLRAQDALMRGLERKPTMEEIAQESGLTLRQIERALDARGIAFPAESIASGAESPTGAMTGESLENTILIRELLPKLDDMERLVITEYYFIGRTDLEIGEQVRLTDEQAKNIRRRALRKLRKMIEASGR